ncbi:response regulator transcription factor [Sphingobacterium sp. DN00404]|uniref:Response regulator transcription factor n=1 Tax=Sphingobacterium micropteri TaxID=2763501 RepID=A0ABR7YJJ2_9SPHI|nr:LytTR family DNA-binding domain-containing protein [Sphingobacterium micropteri]MBD1431421.1 response regulator transcription factor [Sphingobacterium micropteri]
MIKAIAIDDEPIALEIVKAHAEKTPFLSLETTFINAFEAIDYLRKNEIDLLFLDVKMPDISGIEFYNSLLRKPLLVFTTAYSEHAVTGFELEAIDYLLKPFTFVRFLKACNKAHEILQNKIDTIPSHIFIKDGYDTVKVLLDDILFIEATGNYMRYALPEKEILTRATIKETINLLPPQSFMQVHRSFIVNTSKVEKIERHQITIQSHVIPVGGSYIDIVKQKFSTHPHA